MKHINLLDSFDILITTISLAPAAVHHGALYTFNFDFSNTLSSIAVPQRIRGRHYARVYLIKLVRDEQITFHGVLERWKNELKCAVKFRFSTQCSMYFTCKVVHSIEYINHDIVI